MNIGKVEDRIYTILNTILIYQVESVLKIRIFHCKVNKEWSENNVFFYFSGQGKLPRNKNITFRMKGGRRTKPLKNNIRKKMNGKGSFRTIFSRIFILKQMVLQLPFVTLERFYLCRPLCNNNIHVVFKPQTTCLKT